MRIYIEFTSPVVEKIGRRYLWIEIDRERIQLKDLLLEIIPSIIGRDIGVILYELFSKKEIVIAVNGVLVSELLIELKDGDKIYVFQPLAPGG